MDYTSLVIVAGIILYAIFEYQRREQEHRETLSYLKRGEKPPERVQVVEGWKLFTTGGVAVLLLAVTLFLARLAASTPPRYAPPMIVMTGIGALLFAVVILLFLRNFVLYRTAGRTRKENCHSN